MKNLVCSLAAFFFVLMTSGCGGGMGSEGCAGVGCGSSAASPPPSAPPPAAGIVTHFSVTGASKATTGMPISFTVTALDGSSNVVPTYAGTAHFTSSDSRALLPTNSQLNNGTQSFSVTFQTVGDQSLIVADAATPSVTGESAPINVVVPDSLLEASGPLPNGTLGLEYGLASTVVSKPTGCSVSFTGWQLRANGGAAPYVWSWAAAAGSVLPPGLTISTASNTCGGTTRCCTTVTVSFIDGTPTTASTYNVIVTVVDSASPPARASATYALAVDKAQGAATVQTHVRYKLIDLGTLGGPGNHSAGSGKGSRQLNNHGEVAFHTDTSAFDPYAPNFCFHVDCSLAHGAVWKQGILSAAGSLPGINNSAINSINDRGWSTGFSQTGALDAVTGGPVNHATLWKDDEIFDLGTLDGDSSEGVYVNDASQVVGIAASRVPDSFSLLGVGVQVRTFLWEEGKIEDIGTLGGPDTLPGLGCNGKADSIVGQSYIDNFPNPSTEIPTLHPFLWTRRIMTDLGSLGGTLGLAQCANNGGQVIGTATLSGDTVRHAFVWDEDRHRMKDLGTLGGDNSEATWLNDAGEIVGSADLPGMLHHAVLWKDGEIVDLGSVSDDACSNAHAINAHGEVVGGSSDCSKFRHAFFWEQGGPMLDLNLLVSPDSGLQLTNAYNINDRGEILATAVPVGVTPVHDEDIDRVVLLIPCKSRQETGCQITDRTPDVNTSTSLTLVPAQVPKSNPITAIEAANAWRSRLAPQFHLRSPRSNK